MNLQRREEIREIAKEFRRLFLHEQAEAIDELLAYVATLEQAAAERVIADGSRGPGVAPAVVVPDLGEDAAYEACAEWIKRTEKCPSPLEAYIDGWNDLASRLRAIPAGRVLGDGMRQVDARRFERMQAEEAERVYLLELERYVRTMAKLQNWSKDAMDYGPLKNLDALRANQGGLNHGAK